MSDPTVEDFMRNNRDFGLEPLTEPLTTEQRKLAAMAMGMNAAIVKLILEGIFPLEEQAHFMLHLQDYTARIYAGEALKFPDTNITLAVDSVAGKLFAVASEEVLINGHKNYEAIKQMAAEAYAEGDKQTTLENYNEQKPTLH